MSNVNVYVRSRLIVQELGPVVQSVRQFDKSLADQLRRAAQSMVLNIAEARGSDAGITRGNVRGGVDVVHVAARFRK